MAFDREADERKTKELIEAMQPSGKFCVCGVEFRRQGAPGAGLLFHPYPLCDVQLGPRDAGSASVTHQYVDGKGRPA